MYVISYYFYLLVPFFEKKIRNIFTLISVRRIKPAEWRITATGKKKT